MILKMFRATVLLSLFIVNGCVPGNQSEVKDRPIEIIVSAAASLSYCLQEIKSEYENQYPHIKLTLNFGASGVLQKQIEHGAPVDLFLSAGIKQMTALTEQGIIRTDQQINLLTNSLVLIGSKKASLRMNSINDLKKPEISKIAVGEPQTVPAGSYSKQLLDHYMLWDPLFAKLILAKDVRQVLSYVETGNVDVGIVYQTDAILSKKVEILLAPDAAAYEKVHYPMGIIQSSKYPEETKKLFNYLQKEKAAEIFKKYGFGTRG